MRAVAHPVGIRADRQVGRLGTEVPKEFALRIGFGGGMRSRWGIISRPRIFVAHETDSYVGGLGSGAVGEKEIAKGYRIGDAKGSLAIFVVPLDAIFEGS